MTQQTLDIDRSEFHEDCLASRREAVAQGVNDAGNLPFMLYPDGAKTAVLLVHGFTGTPWEMRLLAEELAAANIASYAIRLPGHGTTVEDLATRSWEEWQATVSKSYQVLCRDFTSVFAAGMSTGCLLLLGLAAKNPLRGLILFSPYLRVQHRLAAYAGWLRWIRPYHGRKENKDLARRYYARRPLEGIHQINQLIHKIKKQLPMVSCPVLAFNGEGDQTVEIASGRQLMLELGSLVKIHAVFGPEVPHVLTREENPHRMAMFSQSIDFIQEIETPGRPGLAR